MTSSCTHLLMKLPPPLNWLWSGWMAFSHALGKVMSWIILTMLWIVGFGIYAIIGKIMMLFKRSPVKNSYWIDVPDQGDLRRQF